MCLAGAHRRPGRRLRSSSPIGSWRPERSPGETDAGTVVNVVEHGLCTSGDVGGDVHRLLRATRHAREQVHRVTRAGAAGKGATSGCALVGDGRPLRGGIDTYSEYMYNLYGTVLIVQLYMARAYKYHVQQPAKCSSVDPTAMCYPAALAPGA